MTEGNTEVAPFERKVHEIHWDSWSGEYEGAGSPVVTATTFVPPDVPDVRSAAVRATTLAPVAIQVAAREPNGLPWFLRVEWGDGAASRVPAVGFLEPDDEREAVHAYARPGTFAITTTAENVVRLRSASSAPVRVGVIA